MFFNYVQKAWKRGEVKVGLSADKTDKSVWLESSGSTHFAVKFLSQSEKQKLATLAKSDAKSKL
ncbi:hypothetical protein VV208B2_45220 (plasmid) [Vibrio vulnificus]|nr:hypothetical protein [Vibrio parahaemolyticus]BDP33442.1 hypothetical protein VV208B2_45220 [Vibrio vulnificus]BDP38314.1 hypothetical protein VA208B3_46850 [Vibrio alginolyticus]